jgi:hypothetical protein
MSETLDLRKLIHHDAGSGVPAAMRPCRARVAQTHPVGRGAPLESAAMSTQPAWRAGENRHFCHPKHGPLL